jgi:hypothetical protein
MKQFELSALGLREMEVNEQIETDGGEAVIVTILAVVGGVIAIIGAVKDIYENWDTIEQAARDGFAEGYAAGRN